MKGKYAKKAAATRDWNTLEQRATSAEHERDRLASELSALAEKRRAEVDALRADLKSARAERDQQASPILRKTQELVNQLRSDLEKAAADKASLLSAHDKLTTATAELLMESKGCTGTEAMEMILYAVGGYSGTIYGGPDGVHEKFGAEGNDPQMKARVKEIAQIQRARGNRRLRAGAYIPAAGDQ